MAPSWVWPQPMLCTGWAAERWPVLQVAAVRNHGNQHAHREPTATYARNTGCLQKQLHLRWQHVESIEDDLFDSRSVVVFQQRTSVTFRQHRTAGAAGAAVLTFAHVSTEDAPTAGPDGRDGDDGAPQHHITEEPQPETPGRGLQLSVKAAIAKLGEPTNSTLVVRLVKALYGCVQSAAQWYKHLRAVLKRLGFVPNPCDLGWFTPDEPGDQTDQRVAQGYNCPAAILYEDHKSTIELANSKKFSNPDAQSRHITIKNYLVRDRQGQGEVEDLYKLTGKMVTDLLTKPLQGQRFQDLRARLLNWPKPLLQP